MAITGDNGSGKTTLVSILAGLYPIPPADASKVTLGGAPVGSGEGVGLVPQNSSLLDLSVRENVMYGNEGMGPEACERACAMVGAADFIGALPEGYDTTVGVGGCKLSGGQRQRLALARALAQGPPVLILDEPNSHLDEGGMQALGDVFKRCREEGTTVLVVAHQPEIVALCDREVKL